MKNREAGSGESSPRKRGRDAGGARGRYEVVAAREPVVAESAADADRGRAISATEAARRFSDLINRVGYKGETYVIERGGKPMCKLSPIDTHRFTGSDLLALLATLPRPEAEFLDAVEALTLAQPAIGESPWES